LFAFPVGTSDHTAIGGRQAAWAAPAWPAFANTLIVQEKSRPRESHAAAPIITSIARECRDGMLPDPPNCVPARHARQKCRRLLLPAARHGGYKAPNPLNTGHIPWPQSASSSSPVIS
jgi:hypothetical protein